MKAVALIFILIGCQSVMAQSLIKGTIVDRQSQQPLVGANIVLANGDATAGSVTDLEGRFVLKSVEPGRHTLEITYLGYKSLALPNILVTSGKEVILDIGLEESTVEMDEIVVTADVDKDKANNELATVSARMFTLEEVTRYSGGRNDASRMVANFAGVNIANDSRNDIVIRGNSPVGVLWRLDGMAIPNPNHFATLGTTGGPVSALNTNLLKNSDFLTSAFPAEYGNANAGVFDIQFRSGNRDKFEFTGQIAAFSGMEFMAEGPLSLGNEGSFVVSYRHSFVEVAQAVGLEVGTTAVPAYKDLTFKIDLGRTKSGQWSLFGIGASSDIDFLAEDVEADDFFAMQDQNSYATSQLGIFGLNHRLLIDDRTYLRSTVGFSTAANTFDVEDIDEGGHLDPIFGIDDLNNRFTVATHLNRKVNAKFNYRAGLISEQYILDAFARDKDDDQWITLRDFEGTLGLHQGYVQLQYRPDDQLTLNGGLHAQYLGLNDDFALEPRLAVNWHMDGSQTLSLAYGTHNQMLPLPIYLFGLRTATGQFIQTNQATRFLTSRHFVLAYDRSLGNDWRMKTEAYFQGHVNVPVEQESSSFSVLNVGADFGFPEVSNLQNTGSGKNYGLELTLEKFFSRGYYALLTGSLFESKYKGSDGISRNTAFNNHYTLNFLGGKEFFIGKQKQDALTFDFKITSADGRYFTPIDLASSIASGQEVQVKELAFSEQYDPYFRLDLKFGYRLNNRKRKFSQQFYLDFQNLTNRKNVFIRRYNNATQRIDTIYQIGFFPDILYRIQF